MSLTILRANGSSLTLDAVPSLSRTHSVSVTENPVEAGAAVSDHAQVLPPRFTVAGVVSYEGPLGADNSTLASATAGAAAGAALGQQNQSVTGPLTGRARQNAAEAYLEAILGEPVTIVYRGRSWANIVIEELTLPEEGGTNLKPQITLKQITIVSSQTVRLPRQVRRTKPSLQQEQPVGVQPAPPATPSEASQATKSILATAADTQAGQKTTSFLGVGYLSRTP
jgi:hypothetical protein